MRRVGLEFVGRRGRCSGLTPGQGRGANPCSGPAYPRGRPVRLVGGQRAMEQPAHRHRLKQGGSHVVVVRGGEGSLHRPMAMHGEVQLEPVGCIASYHAGGWLQN